MNENVVVRKVALKRCNLSLSQPKSDIPDSFNYHLEKKIVEKSVKTIKFKKRDMLLFVTRDLDQEFL